MKRKLTLANKPKFLRIGIVVLVGAMILTSCGSTSQSSSTTTSQASSTSSTATPTSITIINSNTLGWAPEFIAQDKGFFKQNGLNVTINFDSGDAQTVPAVATNSAQFGIITTPVLLQALVKKEPLKMVAAIDSQISQEFVINGSFAKKVGITSSMTLAQKMAKLRAAGPFKVGTLDIGGGLQLVFDALAQSYGMTLNKDFTVSAVSPYSSLVIALANDEVNVGLFGPPYGYDAIFEHGATLLADTVLGTVPNIKDYLFGTMATSDAYANAHPQVVKQVQESITEALTLIHANPTEAVAILKKHFPSLSTQVLNTVVEQNGVAFPNSVTISRSEFDRARSLTTTFVFPKVPAINGVTYDSAVWSGDR